MLGGKMGGYGSGRPGFKQKAEQCRSLDVNRLKREGALRIGHVGTWVWSRDDEEVARIGYQTTNAGFQLDYRVMQYGGDWETITQTVPLTLVDCHYGKQRPYFLCPGVVNGRHCGRRVGKLFMGGKYFLCRHCYNVAYTSQSEPSYDRALRRANKLRVALGVEPGMANWIGPKPKGMWHQTYQRKRSEIERYENQANHFFLSKYSNLLNDAERQLFFDSHDI
ncbi:MAG: hypothetical protein ABJH45_02535 [Paracoccaceae bacterium]